MGTLVLTRKCNEKVNINLNTGERLELEVLDVRGKQVRLGFSGCKETFVIERDELTRKGEKHGQIEHGTSARATREDREEHQPDEAPPAGLLPDEEA